MNTLTGITAAAVSLLLLAAAHAQHQGPPAKSADPAIEAACDDIKKVKHRDDLNKAVAPHQSKVNLALAQAMQKVASAEDEAKKAAAALSAAQKAVTDLEVRISNVHQEARTAAGYDAKRKEAQRKIEAINNLAQRHRDAQQAADDAKLGRGQPDQVKALQDAADALKTQSDAANLTLKDEQDDFDYWDGLYKGTTTGDPVAMNRQRDGLIVARTNAAKAHDAAREKVATARRDQSRVRDRQKELTRCVTERTAELDPTLGPQIAYVDGLLKRIAERLAEFEKKAPQMAAGCPPILKDVEALERDLAALGRDAVALAAKAATPWTGLADYQRRYAQATKAQLDARRAEVAISNAKTHAVNAARDACQISDAIVRNPRDPAVRTRIADVQRHRADAEQDVAQTAAAIEQIRAALVSSQAAGSQQTPLTQELAGLKRRADVLKARRDALGEKATPFSGFSTAVNQLLDRLEKAEASANASGTTPNAYRVRATRIADLLNRARKIDKTCVSGIHRTFVDLDNVRKEVDEDIYKAQVAISNTGVLPDPPNITAEIERILNKARTEHEQIRAEATNAVRCEEAARNAINNPGATPAPPPPPPGPGPATASRCKGAPPAGSVSKPDKPGGLTCKYQCGASTIEFTTYDGTITCPPKIEDYTLVGSRSTPMPTGGSIVMSGPAWVKKGGNAGSYGAVVNTQEYSSTTARATSVETTVYDHQIEWTFTAPPVSFSPGDEFTIHITGKVKRIDHGKPAKFPSAPSAGVRVRGLEQVKGENAWADVGAGKAGIYVFRVPANAKGATIEFGGDQDIGGIFAIYTFGDHKPPPR